MKTSRFTDSQIMATLKQAQAACQPQSYAVKTALASPAFISGAA